jgi:hypothetical protein
MAVRGHLGERECGGGVLMTHEEGLFCVDESF